MTSWKQEGGRGRGGGGGNVRTRVNGGERRGQVTSQWYHGISSSTWPALAASWGEQPATTRGTYLALTAAECSNPWPLTNTMSAPKYIYEAVAIQSKCDISQEKITHLLS